MTVADQDGRQRLPGHTAADSHAHSLPGGCVRMPVMFLLNILSTYRYIIILIMN